MSPLPLAGLDVTTAAWPAAQLAGRLLQCLGARVESSQSMESGVALRTRDAEVRAEPTTPEQDWATSGADELTGRADGPALAPVGQPGTLAKAGGLALELISGQPIETTTLLGQRAKLLGFTRNGTVSAGGAARLMPCADGWFALNLPRSSDLELVPALIERAVAGDPWSAVSGWADGQTRTSIIERATLLGLAAAALPSTVTAATPWTVTSWSATQPRPAGRTLRVVNLGALWAAPLCGQLLHRCGLDVVDVESISRPDVSPAEFYSALHDGHRHVTLDFATPHGLDALRALLRDADVVLEASRPRALRSLGVAADTIMADGRERVWVRISGHGQEQNRIAFGDDAAVAGGLVAWDASGPVFAGDALADPLTGILAAVAASACLRAGGSWVIDLSMANVAGLATADRV